MTTMSNYPLVCSPYILSFQYVRIDDETTPDAIWDLMKKDWALKPPGLFLSIVGGNRKTKLDLDIKRALEDGLGKVCLRIMPNKNRFCNKIASFAFDIQHRHLQRIAIISIGNFLTQ